MRGLLRLVVRWPSKHLSQHLPDDAAAKAAALQERKQSASEYRGLLRTEGANALLGQRATRGQLVESVFADGRADGLIHHLPLYTLPPKHLAYLGRCFTTPKPCSSFGVRNVFIRKDATGGQSVERFCNQHSVRLPPPEADLEFSASFSATGQRIDGTIADVRDLRFSGEVSHGIRVELDARPRGARFAHGTDRDGEYASVGERDHKPARST